MLDDSTFYSALLKCLSTLGELNDKLSDKKMLIRIYIKEYDNNNIDYNKTKSNHNHNTFVKYS